MKLNTNFFIPTIVEVNGLKVPSTPFNYHNGEPIFLGDIIKISWPEDKPKDKKEVYLVELTDGIYQGTCKNDNKTVHLWMLEESMASKLGSAITEPDLLEELSK